MKLNFKNRLVIVALASLFAGVAMADTKVGYVDMQKAVQATSAGKKAKADLETEFNKRKKELDKKKEDIEKMGQDLDKKKTVLSEEVLGKKQVEIQEEMMKFQKVVAENQAEIQKKQNELTAPILEKMKKVINKIATDKGYTLVLEKNEQNVLFAQKDIDLTDDVVKSFESQK